MSQFGSLKKARKILVAEGEVKTTEHNLAFESTSP